MMWTPVLERLLDNAMKRCFGVILGEAVQMPTESKPRPCTLAYVMAAAHRQCRWMVPWESVNVAPLSTQRKLQVATPSATHTMSCEL